MHVLWFVVFCSSDVLRPLRCLFSPSPVFVEVEESSGVV